MKILPESLMNSNECESVLMVDINASQQSKIKFMDKIHKQFGHASAENLKRLFKNAGKLNFEIPSLIDATAEKDKTSQTQDLQLDFRELQILIKQRPWIYINYQTTFDTLI